MAVGAGSRGVHNLQPVVRAVIEELKRMGCSPVSDLPAMGSHGGATPEGQASVLLDYGLTPEGSRRGNPCATMDVKQIGTLQGEDAGNYAGHPIFMDCKRFCRRRDNVLINRVKAHTDFSGELESGIGKMSVIGLGKRHGAESRSPARRDGPARPDAAQWRGRSPRTTHLVGGIAPHRK